MEGIEIEVPDREEAACALDTVEARLVRQGQYDAACDVINAKRRIRLDEEEIAALEAQLAQYRWRRVEEEMPQDRGKVLVRFPQREEIWTRIAFYHGDGVWWSGGYTVTPIHWMPMPAAPEEGE